MKKIIFLTLSFMAFSSFAQDMTTEAALEILKKVAQNQNAKSETVISINQNDVEAIISKDDVYVRPVDLEEGIDSISGVNVQNGRVIINVSKPSQLNVGNILLQNGTQVRVIDGGNSGG